MTMYFRELQRESNIQHQRFYESISPRHMNINGHPIASSESNYYSPYSALPAPSEADQLYQEWLTFSRWLKSEEERLAGSDSARARLPYRGRPMLAQNTDDETISVLNRIRMEVDDALVIEQNRVRGERGRREHAPANDTMRREVQAMPEYRRAYTLSDDISMSDSVATIRATRPNSISISPTGSPQLEPPSPNLGGWGSLVAEPSSASQRRASSVRTTDSRLDAPRAYRSSVSGSEWSTAATTPDGISPNPRASALSLANLTLGEPALKWVPLCHKVQVERVTPKGAEMKNCDIHWCYREDAGISLRVLYASTSSFLPDGRPQAKTWITQDFRSTGPPIPLTTTYPDGYVSIGFPGSTMGHLSKPCSNVSYTFADPAAAKKFQTLLYTDNGQTDAKLLYERPVCVSSNLYPNECRHTNLRLWRKRGQHNSAFLGIAQQQMPEVLVLLYYTNNLPEDSAHWVEEQHYAFECLSDSALKESSSTKLKLVFCKDTARRSSTGSKLFSQRRRSSNKGRSSIDPIEENTALSSGGRNASRNSQALSITPSVSSSSSAASASPDESVNCWGYSELKIEFQSKEDRKDFLKIWRAYMPK